MPQISNVEVRFLPPNTTSNIKPLDAGIIDQIKEKFRHRLMMPMFEIIECGQKSIYNIDVLTAISWVSKECSDLRAATIQNCFNH